MESRQQEGIYLNSGEQPGESSSLVFLRVSGGSTAQEIGKCLHELWDIYGNLKKGVIRGLNVKKRYLSSGDLSILIGYSKEIFEIDGVKRKCPHDLLGFSFNNPLAVGGGPIIYDSSLRYGENIKENHAQSDHIVIQFIGNSEFITTRSVVETWKFLRAYKKNKEGTACLKISKVYRGFERHDRRNWLGFHDGVSNIKSNQRKKSVFIDSNIIKWPDEGWLVNGTYLSFIGISIDINEWESIDIFDQELIIGRDKETGCPIIGVDRQGMPVKDIRCPVTGTFEVIEKGNEQFRNLPQIDNHWNKPLYLDDTILRESHVTKAKIYASPKATNRAAHPSIESGGIFRQGYNFFDSSDLEPGFIVGLNFISFQNRLNRLSGILKYGFKSSKFISPLGKPLPTLESICKVGAAGIFIVPAFTNMEYFPGETIFVDIKKTVPFSGIRGGYVPQGPTDS